MLRMINKTERVHKIGSITAGLSLIASGMAYMLYELGVISNYETIIKLWPLILIGLGVEMLYFNSKEENINYDKGGIFIMIIMLCFSMIMATANVCLNVLL